MCTVFLHRPLNLLCKNRDKEEATREEIIAEPDLLGIRTVGSDYFSIAVNHLGCAFAGTAINSPEWTKLVMTGRGAEAIAVAAQERAGLISPPRVLSRMIASVDGIEPLVDRLVKGPEEWLGYNIVLYDRHEAVVVELHRHSRHVRKLAERDAVTNHFLGLDSHGPRHHDDYPSSYDRLEQAHRGLADVESIAGFQALVCPEDPTQALFRWRHDVFRTVSSTVLDVTGPTLFYTDAEAGPWRRATLP